MRQNKRYKQTILVTGGAGFIGSNVTRRLLETGFKVIVVDNLSTGRQTNIPHKADFIKADISKKSIMQKLPKKGIRAVMHFAGQSSGETSFKDPEYDLRSHIMSTFYLLDWCLRQSIKRFLYASSMGVYGDPIYLPVDESHPKRPKTYYGAAKISAEAYIKFYQSQGIDTTIFRLFSVYGPGQNLANKSQGIVSIYLSYLLEDKPILVKGSEERFRDLVYIDDVVDAWLVALDNPISYGRTYNLASGVKTRVKDMIRLLLRYTGRPDNPVHYVKGTPGDQFGIVGDGSLARAELKWDPKIAVNSGIAKYVAFEVKRKRLL